MKMDEVMLLVKAGFTKDEISKMLGMATQPAQDKTPEVPPTEEKMNDMEKVLVGLSDLTKAIHASNLLNTEQKPVDSVDDVFAHILGGEVNGK